MLMLLSQCGLYSGHDFPQPTGVTSHPQKTWDFCRVSASVCNLLEGASDAQSQARLVYG